MLDLIQTRRALHQTRDWLGGVQDSGLFAGFVIEKLTTGKDFVQMYTWQTGIGLPLQGSQPERTIGWHRYIDGVYRLTKTGTFFASQHQSCTCLWP